VNALAAAEPYFREVTRQFDLVGSAALLARGSGATSGMSYDEVRRRASDSDLLVNVSGMLADEELVSRVSTRLYLDLDPAFNQLWCAAEGIDVGLNGHTHFATVGQALGRNGCAVPTCGVDWIRTLPP